ncbi:sigma-70 family RNA polymerase sigma factor [Sedimentibacter hydroxybenzoicus DSM 7310]|uniref:Sigma-70 family RNA polymerase sigma factor n=1 Tax=Sedimentibacter hydroxybenzoicus DSM 7310 TaxID=1123245 RepID=A0A974BHE8_SEDHY|nr:sigma-70 family RNA polymerase sigma factor [Sedimentibacter hydroxybenzoicus]NYB72740.1 sigma-70 family RNA polymerase sigma factor [Sedimentibacter hydroxybenzoicus DSM 7310]
MANEYNDKEQQVISKEEFCRLIKEYQTSLYRLAKSILLNEHDTEDAVCSAIYKAYISRNTIRKINSFKSWILKIVSNEAYTILRNKKNVVYVDTVSESTSDTYESEVPYDVWDAVEKLDEKYRAIIVLFYYDDFSIKHISEILSIPQNTVKTRLLRARQKLKTELLNQEGYINE